jgi:hypothetical protein
MASSMLSKINVIAVDMVQLESLHLSDPLASMRLIGESVTHEICDPVSKLYSGWVKYYDGINVPF